MREGSITITKGVRHEKAAPCPPLNDPSHRPRWYRLVGKIAVPITQEEMLSRGDLLYADQRRVRIMQIDRS